MNANIIIPFFQGTFTAGLLALVLRQRKQGVETRLFSIFLGSMSLWGIFIGLMRSSSNPGVALTWERVALSMIAMTAVFFYLFSLSYTRSAFRLSALLCGIYLVCTVSIALMPVSIWIKGMAVDRFGNAPEWGPLFYPWMFVIYLFMLLAMLKMERARRVTDYYEVRNRYAYLTIGVSLCLIGGISDVISALGVPIYPGSIIGNIGFATVTTMAMLRYHLFDIRVVITRSLSYLLTGIVVLIPVSIVGLCWVVLANIWDLPEPTAYLPLILLLFIVPPMWDRVYLFVSSRIRRVRHAYLAAADKLSGYNRAVSDLKEFCEFLVNLLRETLGPAYLLLFTQREDGSYGVTSALPAGPETEDLMRLNEDSHLVLLLKSENKPVWRRHFKIYPSLQAMSRSEIEVLDKVDADIYFPLGIQNLIGILALGPKARGRIYAREDLEFLASLLHQAGLIMDNISLFNQEQAQRKRVEQFNIERTTFLDALAHEMKTPLTSAMSSSELLEEELAGLPENLRLLASDIRYSVNNIQHIVNDILEFGRMQQARIRILPQSFNLCRLVPTVRTEFKNPLRKKGQELVLNLPDNPLWVNADPTRVKQVLNNLIDNASKFSRTECEIKVMVRQFSHRAEIEVEDCADPIPPDEKEHLFTPYYRGDVARHRHLPGLGLGLYICKQLVQIQGGRMWLKTNGKAGNIFGFSIPCEANIENIDN